MAFKIGGTTVIDNSINITSGTANGTAATPTGFKNSGGTDVGNLIRFTSYTDDKAANCRGYLPNGNCAGNSLYDVPNGNWWTWGVSGVPTGNCITGGGNANCSNVLYAVSVAYVYDGYYELYNRVRGSEQHRNYSHCNCGNCVGNCYTNCNCNCNC
jgi:hypothetical protein